MLMFGHATIEIVRDAPVENHSAFISHHVYEKALRDFVRSFASLRMTGMLGGPLLRAAVLLAQRHKHVLQ
jgi:hypothetical protein